MPWGLAFVLLGYFHHRVLQWHWMITAACFLGFCLIVGSSPEGPAILRDLKDLAVLLWSLAKNLLFGTLYGVAR